MRSLHRSLFSFHRGPTPKPPSHQATQVELDITMMMNQTLESFPEARQQRRFRDRIHSMEAKRIVITTVPLAIRRTASMTPRADRRRPCSVMLPCRKSQISALTFATHSSDAINSHNSHNSSSSRAILLSLQLQAQSPSPPDKLQYHLWPH